MRQQGRYVFSLELIVPGNDTDGIVVTSTEIQAVSEVLATCETVATAQNERVQFSMCYGSESESLHDVLPKMLEMARAGLREAGLDGSVFVGLTVGDTNNPASDAVVDVTDEMLRLELEGA
jgi:hypothetical protein